MSVAVQTIKNIKTMCEAADSPVLKLEIAFTAGDSVLVGRLRDDLANPHVATEVPTTQPQTL